MSPLARLHLRPGGRAIGPLRPNERMCSAVGARGHNSDDAQTGGAPCLDGTAKMKCSHAHDRRERRLRRALTGAIEQEQCLDCGRGVGEIWPASIDAHKLTRWVYVKRPGRRKLAYMASLRTTRWQRLREEVLARDNFECRSCGEPATELHHITYIRFSRELPEDVVAACRDCQKAERELRWALR